MNNKRTIIYCRESRDDYGENIERIETQRDILLEFCKKQGLTNVIDVVMDDNVSGTKFERFDKIIKMAKNRQVDVLVFKDASRLGRNLRESLNFLHVLEECDVEVLFESETYDEAFFPLLAWFNEQRAREDSKKVRRVFKHKMETGELVIKPIYGYNKMGNKLLVNPQMAETIRRIYSLFLEGHGSFEIATMLNYQRTPTPSQTLFASDDRPICHAWNRQHIYRILTNRAYTGDMVYSKATKKSFKSSKVIRKKPDEWIIVSNHHEAIIDRETFDKVQKLRARAKIQKKTSKEPRLFSGLLVCGRCGGRLVQRTRTGRKNAYICGKYQREGCVKDDVRPNYGCATHFLLEEDLTEIATDFCRDLLAGNDQEIEGMLRLKQVESPDTSTDVQKEIMRYEAILERIYDDRLLGVLPEALYQKKLAEYMKKLEESRISLQVKKQDNGQKKIDIIRLRQTLREFTSESLNNRTLKQIFNHIIYFLPGEMKEKHMIQYNMDDQSYQRILAEGGLIFKVSEF